MLEVLNWHKEPRTILGYYRLVATKVCSARAEGNFSFLDVFEIPISLMWHVECIRIIGMDGVFGS